MGEYEDRTPTPPTLPWGPPRYVVDNVPAAESRAGEFDYNNVNFQALGVVLEAATGRRYADYLSEKLWKPIGAGDRRSGWTGRGARPGRSATSSPGP